MHAFVLMPFDDNFIDVYNFGIKEAANEVSINAYRLDEQIFDTDMLQKIYSEIDKADLIIADMSNRNPNVFYEVGYSDAKKKMVILLTNNGEDIPFDLKHRPHIIYDNVSSLKAELIKKLTWAKSEIISIQTEPVIPSIAIRSCYIDRKEYQDIAIIKTRLSFHNRTDNVVDKISSIYLHTGTGWTITYEKSELKKTDSSIQPFSQRHILQPGFTSIPPSDWYPIDIEMRKVVYNKWSKEVQKDEYELEGIVKIQINIEHNKFVTEHVLKQKIEFNDIPF